jgi:hypothetical protein
VGEGPRARTSKTRERKKLVYATGRVTPAREISLPASVLGGSRANSRHLPRELADILTNRHRGIQGGECRPSVDVTGIPVAQRLAGVLAISAIRCQRGRRRGGSDRKEERNRKRTHSNVNRTLVRFATRRRSHRQRRLTASSGRSARLGGMAPVFPSVEDQLSALSVDLLISRINRCPLRNPSLRRTIKSFAAETTRRDVDAMTK